MFRAQTEDNLGGRQPQWKTASAEDGLGEDGLGGRRTQRKTASAKEKKEEERKKKKSMISKWTATHATALMGGAHKLPG